MDTEVSRKLREIRQAMRKCAPQGKAKHAELFAQWVTELRAAPLEELTPRLQLYKRIWDRHTDQEVEDIIRRQRIRAAPIARVGVVFFWIGTFRRSSRI